MHSVPGVSTSVLKKGLQAAKWSYLGVAVRIVTQLAAQIALARMLGPESFGLFALAAVIVGIGNLLADMGFGAALTQKEHLTHEDIRLAFTWQVIVGLIVTGILIGTADLTGRLLGDDRVIDVVRAMSFLCLLQAISSVSHGLLKRELDFKTIQIAQIVSYIVGFLLVGVLLAYSGAGVWALAAAWLTQSAVAFLLLYAKTRHAIKPLASGLGRRHIARFGGSVLMTNLANWSIENLDNFLIGRLFGAQSLGLYSVAYNLVRAPTNHLVSTLQPILFSASARARNHGHGLRLGYAALLAGVCLVATPIFWGVAVVSDTVVRALYGSAWSQASGLLLPLALAMPVHAVMAVSGPLLWGKGRVMLEFRVQFWVAALLIAAVLLASQISLTAAAWAVLLIYVIRSVWMISTVSRELGLMFLDVWRSLRGGILLGALTAAVVAALDMGMTMAGIPPILRLLGDVFVGALALPLLFSALAKWALPSPEVRLVAGRALKELPEFLREWLQRRLGGADTTGSGSRP